MEWWTSGNKTANKQGLRENAQEHLLFYTQVLEEAVETEADITYNESLHWTVVYLQVLVSCDYFYNLESKHILVEYVPLHKSELFIKIYINCIWTFPENT